MTNNLQKRTDANDLQRWSESGSPGDSQTRSVGFEGWRLIHFIRRGWKLFGIVLVITVGIGGLLTARQPKIYVSKTTVLLDQRKQQVVQDLNEVVSSLPSDSSTVDTEVSLLNSPGMAYQVANYAGLLPSSDPQSFKSEKLDQSGNILRSILTSRSAQRIGLTYMIDISYSSTDPKTAQFMADAYAQTYVRSQVEVRVHANERVREHLQQEIVKLQAEVKDADAAVARYKSAHGLTDTSANGTLTEQEISSYNQALATARAQEADDAQRLAAARRQLNQGGDAMGDASPALTALRAQESQLSASVADLSSRYGNNHPELATARQQLEDVRRLIAAQSRRTVASLEAQAQASAGRAGAITSRLSATENDLQRAGAAAVELHELQMKLDAPQKLLEAYQARIAQLSTQSGAEQPDARIVSPAQLPDAPSSPRWTLNIVAATALGIAFGLIAVLLRQILTSGIGSTEEVEISFGVDFLAALPVVKNADDRALMDKVVEEPSSPFAEALRGLAASILFAGKAAPRLIAVTSAFSEEGKTTTSISLGRVIALRGRSVLVIDCDVQHPAFYRRFGIGGPAGLVDVLQDIRSFDKVVSRDDRTGAHFLSLGGGLEPGRSLNEADLAKLLADLRVRYDVVILDLPPVLQVAEARVFAGFADVTVVLARWKRTSKQAVEAALAILFRINAPVAGIALTYVPSASGYMLYGYDSPTGGRLEAPAP